MASFVSHLKAWRLSNKGITLSIKGSWDEAIGYLERSHNLSAPTAKSLSALGMSYYGKEDYVRASSSFAAAIGKEPFSPDAYFVLGSCYYFTGPAWKMAYHYRAYLDFRTEGTRAQLARSNLAELDPEVYLFDLQQWMSSTRTDYADWVEYRTQSAIEKAGVQHKASDPEKRAALLELTRALTNEEATPYFRNAAALIDNGKHFAGIVQATTGLEMSPHHPFVLTGIMAAYLMLNEYKQAARILEVLDFSESTLQENQAAVKALTSYLQTTCSDQQQDVEFRGKIEAFLSQISRR